MGQIKTPDGRKEVLYHCETCGATNDHHKSQPAGHEQKAVCIDCGADTLILRLADDN